MSLEGYTLEKIILLVVDLLAVSFVLYRVYILFSRTRAVQLLIGFGLILLADYAAHQLQLHTISWLITNVTSYLVIGLIVLLQPELRRLVYEMGRMPLFKRFSPQSEVPLDEIIVAVRDMSLEKIGSIIIILRENRPTGIIENAVPIDAAITTELLETIFFKDTPLHDGAVIIEGSRIVAASCYLPMSASLQIKKTYGARHRAALGFSEESDAILIVTSEETGKVTMMRNGDMLNVRLSQLEPFLEILLKERSIKLKDVATTVKEMAEEQQVEK